MPRRVFQVKPEEEGERIDRLLSVMEWAPSRAYIQKLLKNGKVFVNGSPVKASYRLAPGDEIIVEENEPAPAGVKAQPLPLDILYEDEDLVVIDKPRGMVVHPAPGNQENTLVNALLAHCRELSGIGGVARPGIVHRLDKDTSGVLVAAKNDFTHLALARQFQQRTMTKKYLALVHGRVSLPEGEINAPIGRHPVHRKKMAVLPNGKPAVTRYRLLEYAGSCSFLEITLETGRTHQIRVHMQHIGHPLVGDGLYGRKREQSPLAGQALHAAVLGFVHPRTGHYQEFTAPLPPEMEETIAYYRKN
ncbi:MAG TPA: RluA family pseudouridine synthase [Firmicutes bacterium]|jgi:23S rRNA pseudouridine1911/1915/1917 synthase|nr:RluA family pseudouridine synthase [Bacillota bacterium]